MFPPWSTNVTPMLIRHGKTLLKRACRCATLALLWFTWSSDAGAQPTASEIVVARRMFEQGRALQEHNEWAHAIVKYRQALTIKDTPGLRYRVGYCEEQLGHLVEAGLEYKRAAELLESGVQAEDVAELLPPALAAVERRTPQITLSLKQPVPGATLRIDGHPVAKNLLGQRIPLNPGRHDVLVSAPGYRDSKIGLDLREAERRRVIARLVRDPYAEPNESGDGSMPPDATGGLLRTGVLVAEASLAAAGVAVGLIYTAERRDTDKRIRALNRAIDSMPDADQHSCIGATGDLERLCEQLQSAIDDRKRSNRVAGAGFVAAGVGAAAAVVTYFTWPSSSTQVAPLVSPAGGGFSLLGTF